MCEKAENLLEKKTGNEYYILYIRFFYEEGSWKNGITKYFYTKSEDRE